MIKFVVIKDPRKTRKYLAAPKSVFVLYGRDCSVDNRKSTGRSESIDKEADTRLNLEKAFLEKPRDALPVGSAFAMVRSLFKIDETKKSDGNSCKQSKIVFWIEKFVLIWICIAVAGGFTVPIIIYALDTDRGNNTRSLSDFNLNSCPTTLVQVCTDI